MWKAAVLRIVLALLALCLSFAAGANRFEEFQKLKGEGKLEAAVETLRAEIASPSFALGRGAQPVFIRQHFLLSLGELAARTGVTPAMDAEAKRVYEEGLRDHAAGDAEREAYMVNGMALYYSNSHRNGLALPFMRKELEYWQRGGNRMRLMLGYDALAGAYWDMGEFELSRHQLDKVLNSAAGYFVLGERPKDLNEWVQYWTVLGKHMDNAAQVRDAALLERLWKLQQPIEPRYWGNGALTGFTAAQNFAFAGQRERATATLAEASRLWQEMRAKGSPRLRELGDAAEVCSKGIVAVAVKAYPSAVADLERCIERQAAVSVKEHEANFKQKLGEALEHTGNVARATAAYRESIASAESTRASYTVAERTRFFRTFLRRAYWGLVRIQARAAESEAAFFEALHTSEMVRGRQLGELIDADASARVSPQALQAMQKKLPPDVVLLAYTATDGELIVLGMTSERRLAVVLPYDADAFSALMRATAVDLARPTSDRGTLEQRLLNISRTVLGPVRTLLEGRKRVVALPDGVMNLVPFDLLSADDGAYRPLLDAAVVSASPSLVFIDHVERRRKSGERLNLLALADPIYGTPGTFASASADEVRSATRGSRYLSYFERLPETRTEAEAIAGLFAGQKVDLLTGDEALESRLKAMDLRPYGYLHLATHGILGNEVPGIGEPALVLGAEPGEDGFLTASEVAAMRLDAELTVLSACNTGSGEFISGEGVLGMSRAFLTAGSSAVVVSLWPVASKQTETLMVRFYRHLRGGLPAADALRTAKRDMLAEARKTGSPEIHPFFWAAFILLGG